MNMVRLVFLLLLTQGLWSQTSVSTDALSFRNIGPANSGGRISDIEAHAKDFTKVYVAAASGGVWKSENAGTSWQPIFDQYETASIGDIALDPNDSNTIWVGTGEANNRNSVSWGNGIYKSTDGGQNFQLKGLESTHQIARVLVHPEDSEEVCVCALGHLWGYSGDRGLFMSKNGGDSWQKKSKGLPDDGKTGCIDLVRDSKNPDILYAAFYHRLREPWTFYSGGGQGGIYKSTDGGESWIKLTNGLPHGPTGRIGLAIYEKNPSILMAIVEAEKSDSLSTPGSGIYRTEDGGDSWTYVNTYNNRPFYYSQIRINPNDDQRVYVLTTRFMVSEDGGHSFVDGSADQEVHGDFHAMWLDPNDKDRYYLGADKGFSLTHDHGAHFQLIDNLPVTQFYRINYDMQEPYYVYGGLQDNGSYATASFSRDARGILNDHNWKMHWGDGQDAAINPFDPTDGYSSTENGGYVKYNPKTRDIFRIRPNHSNTVNFDEVFEGKDIAEALRFNWSAPLVMSPHDPHTIYVAGNHVFKSTNQGQSWTIISSDLSTNDPIKRQQGKSGGITPDNTGAETHCTVYALAISPISEDVIWAGTDDGQVQVSLNGGQKWINLTANLPNQLKGLWVSRVEASHFNLGRAYITYDGHRSDNFETHVYMTDDYGTSWKKITNGISKGETVRVIREDHINPNLLFIGTETGVWYSTDRGSSWLRMTHGLPTVSVYDIKIHPRDNDLIIGTHGRGIWIMDDISPLQQLSNENLLSPLVLFDQKTATIWHNISRGGQRGHFWFAGQNPPSIINTSTVPRANFDSYASISFQVNQTNMDSINLSIKDPSGRYQANIKIKVNKGINRYYWDRSFDPEAYTDEEKAKIEALFTSIMKYNDSNFIASRLRRFRSSKNAEDQHRALSGLADEYPEFSEFDMPKASAGVYRVMLNYADQQVTGYLTIRQDPMKP